MAMLFDQIFKDPKIPHGMKWLVGRLQIPMLKVAILDKAFFSTRTHPARQMLDTLGEIAVGLPADFDSSNPLYKRLETIVEKLTNGFEESLEIFDVLRQELQEVVAQENQRVEEHTRSAAKRMEQKERLGVAKALARDEIKARLRAGPMPNAVLKFLAQQWIKLLLITYAKRGKDGDAWKSALETMDQLIWSVRSKPHPRSAASSPRCCPVCSSVWPPGCRSWVRRSRRVRRFLADLMKLHTKAMGDPVARSEPAAEPNATSSAEAKVNATRTEGIPPPSSEAPVASFGRARTSRPRRATPPRRNRPRGLRQSPTRLRWTSPPSL